MSADDMNRAWKTGKLKMRIEDHKMVDIPANVDLTCNDYFAERHRWLPIYQNGLLDEDLEEYSREDADYWFCEIVNVTTTTKRGNMTTTARPEVWYTVRVWEERSRPHGGNDKNPKEPILWSNCPKQVFHFQDKPYTSDLFLENAFRHDMRVPDDMFPDAWRNWKKKQTVHQSS